MEIIISNESGKPIYEQIKEQIKTNIINNELKEGDLLPSIRVLARDLHCSVITTKNAYEELEKEGYIKSVPAKGFYVSAINKELAREEQLNKIEKYLEEAVRIAKMNNINSKILKDMIDILEEDI